MSAEEQAAQWDEGGFIDIGEDSPALDDVLDTWGKDSTNKWRYYAA